MLPRTAMPSALPTSRAVSLTAEATPCLPAGSDRVIAVVDGAPDRAMPVAKSTMPVPKTP